MHLLALAAAEHPLIDLDSTVFVQLGIFLVTTTVLNHFLFQPFLAMRAQRELAIDGAKDEARRMEDQANAAVADYEDKFGKAKLKAYEERLALRGKALGREREISDAARQKSQAALETARVELARDTEAARAELAPRAQDIAHRIAQKILGREVA